MFSKLRNYIKQEETKIYYIKNKINVINYKKILVFEDNTYRNNRWYTWNKRGKSYNKKIWKRRIISRRKYLFYNI